MNYKKLKKELEKEVAKVKEFSINETREGLFAVYENVVNSALSHLNQSLSSYLKKEFKEIWDLISSTKNVRPISIDKAVKYDIDSCFSCKALIWLTSQKSLITDKNMSTVFLDVYYENNLVISYSSHFLSDEIILNKLNEDALFNVCPNFLDYLTKEEDVNAQYYRILLSLKDIQNVLVSLFDDTMSLFIEHHLAALSNKEGYHMFNQKRIKLNDIRKEKLYV